MDMSVMGEMGHDVIQTGISVAVFRPQGDLFIIDQECTKTEVRSYTT